MGHTYVTQITKGPQALESILQRSIVGASPVVCSVVPDFLLWCAQELRIPTSPQILHREHTVAGVYGDIAGAREYLHESTEGIIIREEVFGDAVDAEEKTAAPSTQGQTLGFPLESED